MPGYGDSLSALTTIYYFRLTCESILDDPKNDEVMRWSEDGQSVYTAPESKFSAYLL
jgi:hypothetical protein